MFKLPVRTWILNAAAVFSGPHGAVTRQAQQAGCSRQTVYEHARELERRLADPPDDRAAPAALEEENRRLRQEIADLRRDAEHAIRCDKAVQRRLTTTAFAMGLSTRPIEELLSLLLPADADGVRTRSWAWTCLPTTPGNSSDPIPGDSTRGPSRRTPTSAG
jgi:hypothetical protein